MPDVLEDDDPAEQGHRGDKDLPTNIDREGPRQSGGERGHLPADRERLMEDREQSER